LVGEENETFFIRVGKPLPFKNFEGKPGKAQRRQYLMMPFKNFKGKAESEIRQYP